MKLVHELFDANIVPTDDEAYQKKTWGNVWGLNNDVGQIKKVLMKRPGKEIIENINNENCVFEEDYGSWVNKDKKGYWISPDKSLPDIELMQAQHDQLAQILKDEGAEVIYVDYDNEESNFSKAVNVRDVISVTPGGAILNRMAPAMRQGEEKFVTRTLADIGMPINGSIIGKGVFEGGSFGFLTPNLAFAGHSKRGNREAISQLESILSTQNIDLVTIPLVGHSLHTDSAFTMVDIDKAVIIKEKLPYWFLEMLDELGIKGIDIEPNEKWAVNCLAIKPGKVVVAKEASNSIENMIKAGIEVIPLDYSEVQKNGGGIHCTTNPIIRDSVI
ncbi:dimethylarginine dimethylaminohydrolase family protein [Virgibacillus kimchii]